MRSSIELERRGGVGAIRFVVQALFSFLLYVFSSHVSFPVACCFRLLYRQWRSGVIHIFVLSILLHQRRTQTASAHTSANVIRKILPIHIFRRPCFVVVSQPEQMTKGNFGSAASCIERSERVDVGGGFRSALPLGRDFFLESEKSNYGASYHCELCTGGLRLD